MSPARCYLDVSPLSDAALFRRCLEDLPWEERKQRVLRYRFEKDRMLCLGAGILARHMLTRAGATDLRLRREEWGRPCLTAHPDIHFSLSHSGILAVCAVSPSPVGIDVETARWDPDIAPLCFQEEEIQWILSSPDRDLAFLRLWTRKESYLKRLGTGLSRSPAGFSVLPGGPLEEEVHFLEATVMNHQVCACFSPGEKAKLQAWHLK